MFRRSHHQRVAEVLSALRSDLLVEHQCWFGGGTAIVLQNGEYRESVDIDFLVSETHAYRALRQLVRDDGVSALASRELVTVRAPQVDGYGIRASVVVVGVPIKFEIIHEGRIELDVPEAGNEVCGVRALTRGDQVASKLLANDDRWADTSTFSRDLIDLAMMRPTSAELAAGGAKAVDAYGRTIGDSLDKAVESLRGRPERLSECVSALRCEAPPAEVWQAIRTLVRRCAATAVLGPPEE